MMWFEIYESAVYYPHTVVFTRFEWHWRLRSCNGRKMADSGEGYSSKSGVKRAINRITTGMLRLGHRLPIREVES
jgi:uncharacterized protein YegP (UPF0339 family)